MGIMIKEPYEERSFFTAEEYKWEFIYSKDYINLIY